MEANIKCKQISLNTPETASNTKGVPKYFECEICRRNILTTHKVSIHMWQIRTRISHELIAYLLSLVLQPFMSTTEKFLF